MSTISIKDEITNLLSDAIALSIKDVDKSIIDVSHPDIPDHGDYTTNIALKLKGGRELAESIVENIKSSPLVTKVEIAGPGFINLWLSQDALCQEISKVVHEKDDYGRGEWGHGKTWLIEHTSPNPNKAMHFGHLRNNLVGMAIANIWEFGGVKVIRDEVDNNRGIAIAKLMWGYLKFAPKTIGNDISIEYWFEHQNEWNRPEDLGVKPDHFVDDLYLKASIDMESSPEIEQKIRQLVIDWEAEDKKTHELWKKVLSYSYQGQEITLKRLGNKWDYVWHESDHYKKGKEYIEKGLEIGIFRKGENGAIVTNLSKQKIPDTVVLKSDGTSLYLTQDIALTNQKINKFNPDKLFWVIGPEQSLAMKQLFAVCNQLGIGDNKTMVHLSYGFVTVKGTGKMSSRKGNALFIDNLLDSAKTEAKKKISKPEISEDKKNEISETIGVGAIKYGILKVSRMQGVEVDLTDVVSLEGNSGPYVQYVYARTQSLFRKSKLDSIDNIKIDRLPANLSMEELSLLRMIYKFPEVTQEAGLGYEPCVISSYIFELSKKFNSFYGSCSIIDKDTKSINHFRLLLTMAVGQIIKNGLLLLGINVVDEM